jgi:Skp family chaperone for outer membrane proteins
LKSIKIWLSIAILALLGLGIFFSTPYLKAWFLEHNGVGSIDRDLIYKTAQYKAIQKQLEDFVKEKETEFIKKYQKANKVIKEMAYERFQEEITAKRTQLINNFLTKVENAVATVAKQKGLNVVLDNNIVICGVQDITSEVLEKLKNAKEIPPPKDSKLPASLIAYFDQEVIHSLKVYQDANHKLLKLVETAQKDFDAKSKGLSKDKKQALFEEYQTLLERQKEALLTPLNNKVTQIVEEVAKDQGLSLVVNKDEVMYGGRNITDEVVKKILGK